MQILIPSDILDLIYKLPNPDTYIFTIGNDIYITDEWLVGTFAGRSFVAKTAFDAAQQLIDYLYQHLHHDSIVGSAVTRSGFPNLEKVYNFCMED